MVYNKNLEIFLQVPAKIIAKKNRRSDIKAYQNYLRFLSFSCFLALLP